jgi:hypothetical protein
LKVPVRLSPVAHTPFYWAEQAAELAERNDGSLVSVQEREAPRRRRMFALTAFILATFVLLALGATGAVEVMRQVELKSLREAHQLIDKLQERKSEWQRKYADAARKRELVRTITEQRRAPVGAWFLGYLAEAVPDDLIVSDLRVVWTNQAWAVRLSGLAQPRPRSGSPALPTAGPQAFAVLTNRLASGPFHLQITNSAFGRLNTAPTNSVGRPMPRLRVETGPGSNLFFIEGVVQ